MGEGSIITNILHGAVIALFGWNIVRFSVAIRHGFSRPAGVSQMMRVLAVCGGLSALTDLVIVAVAKPSWVFSLMGILLLVASWILLGASLRATEKQKLSLAFSEDLPDRINISGPYRRIRHPFYTSYLLTWLAAFVSTLHPAALIALCLMGGFYVVAALHEERKFFRSKLSDDYQIYRSSAGMFLPKFPDSAKQKSQIL